MNLLHVDSSIMGAQSVSRALTDKIVALIKDQYQTVKVTRRDLTEQIPSHLSVAHMAALQGKLPEDKSLQADYLEAQNMLEEFLAADTIVIGAPMYNFSIPSQLKAWVDRICVAGKTFRYTENGPEGLAENKKAVVAVSRGGFYGGDSPLREFEHQDSYLKIVLQFIGITDITFIRAEGISKGPEYREQAMAAAYREINEKLSSV